MSINTEKTKLPANTEINSLAERYFNANVNKKRKCIEIAEYKPNLLNLFFILIYFITY